MTWVGRGTVPIVSDSYPEQLCCGCVIKFEVPSWLPFYHYCWGQKRVIFLVCLGQISNKSIHHNNLPLYSLHQLHSWFLSGCGWNKFYHSWRVKYTLGLMPKEEQKKLLKHFELWTLNLMLQNLYYTNIYQNVYIIISSCCFLCHISSSIFFWQECLTSKKHDCHYKKNRLNNKYRHLVIIVFLSCNRSKTYDVNMHFHMYETCMQRQVCLCNLNNAWETFV